MSSRLDIRFEFTQRALASIRAKYGQVVFSFKSEIQAYPSTGDLIQVESVEEITFIVIGRLFKYEKNGNLAVTFLLDVTGEDARSRLRLVDERAKPGE
jgi:hypothetical protein